MYDLAYPPLLFTDEFKFYFHFAGHENPIQKEIDEKGWNIW
jgi:hypothetical protein